jgi:hypothetical protein
VRGTVRERLRARLAPCPDEGCRCLLWTGCLTSKGYGCIQVSGKAQLVHRVAWELEHGPIPGRLTIDHVYDRGCRHKNCADVAHLEPVTARENIQRSFASNPRHGRPETIRDLVSDSRAASLLDGEFWRGFREWAGPEEWADLAPAARALAEAAS